jgi:hypothetical protein
MKFKALFIIFNVVLIVSFVLIFFAPLIFLGEENFLLVIKQNLPISALFLLLLLFFNIYFLLNLRFYSYLEKEDWNGLIGYLENSIYKRGSTRSSYIKILINSYLVTSNIEDIKKLEKYLMKKSPSRVQKFSTQFSIPHLLSHNPEEAEDFFNSLLEMGGTHNRDWIKWNYAFSLMQQNKEEQGKNVLVSLLHFTRDAVLLLLTLYLLESYAKRDAEIKEETEKSMAALKANCPEKTWEKILEEAKKKNIEVLMLSQIIKDASSWFFNKKSEGTAQTQAESTATT